jgi:hypothetical protein
MSEDDRSAVVEQIKLQLKKTPRDFRAKLRCLLSYMQDDPDLIRYVGFGLAWESNNELRYLVCPSVLAPLLGITTCGLKKNFDNCGIQAVSKIDLPHPTIENSHELRKCIVRMDAPAWPSLELTSTCILSLPREDQPWTG